MVVTTPSRLTDVGQEFIGVLMKKT